MRSGHHGVVHRAGTIVGLSLLVLGAGASFAAVGGSAASSCSSTVTVTGPHNGHLILTPSAAKLQVGECLAFTNSTAAAVNIAITKAGTSVYSATVAAGGTTASQSSYAPKTAGGGSISATSHVLLLKLTGSGSVTVSPASTPSPSKSGSPAPHQHQSSAPARPRHHHPSTSPTRHHKSRKSGAPAPHATGFKLPPLPPLPSAGQSALPRGSRPLVAPGLTSPAPATTESSTPVAVVVAGPLDTAEDTSRGLPIAVAVLVVLGLVSGYGRVLLAAQGPVDKRSDGGHRV